MWWLDRYGQVSFGDYEDSSLVLNNELQNYGERHEVLQFDHLIDTGGQIPTRRAYKQKNGPGSRSYPTKTIKS